MRIKATLLLITLFILVQSPLAQDKTVNIECNLSINETEWIKNSQLTAILTVKNNSDKEVQIYLSPSFILEKKGINNSQIIFGDQYSSKEKEKDYIITKKTRNGYSYKIHQSFEFSLKSGESKTQEFNLSKLAWNDSMSSILVDFDWYKSIPNGNYNLYYEWGYYLDKDKKTKRLINIFSNKIEVELNSKK